jgi:UTP--glucose-1-phosphate uridylyltransferase
MKRVTKAVFPAAGLGTRFLPATKANPKEMLPIVDKPLIQYAAEEAAAAGITDLIFIIGRSKRSIADHFDKAYELEVELETKGKLRVLEELRGMLPINVNCIYIRQAEALGLGHAVLCAQPAVNDEPFAVLLADDLIDGKPGVTKQMCDLYSYYQCSLVGVQNVDPSETGSYGIVAAEPMADRIVAGHPDRRETQTGGCAFQPGCGWPLCADAAHLPSPAPYRTRRRRRTATDRRHRCLAQGAAGAGLRVRRQAL